MSAAAAALPATLPTHEQLMALPPFEGLELPAIHVPQSAREAEQAAAILLASGAVGFDTESKPTFAKHEVSTGPHLVQFATRDAAWLFQMHHAELHAVLARLLGAAGLLKVGFGLASDLSLIRQRLGIEPQGVLDLDSEFRRRGHRQSIGVRTAVALMFERRFVKSRKATTSNWARRDLSEAQRRYAANDAYAALRVFDALGLAPPREN